MSIICSFMGHDWGETQTETEYDEGTDEIAVTEREFRVCDRCGERRIVSENTEVRVKSDTTEGQGEKDHKDDREPETTEADSPVGGDTTEEPDGERKGDEKMEVEKTQTEGEEKRDATIIEDTETASHKEGSGETTPTTEPVDGDYRCPECSFVSTDSALREGDICPDCGTGYIEKA